LIAQANLSTQINPAEAHLSLPVEVDEQLAIAEGNRTTTE
jgi:hypothetical protein